MSNIVAIISLVFSAITVIFVGATFVVNSRKDKFQDGQDDGGMRGDIKYMRNSMDDIRLDLREYSRTQALHGERLTRVEESVKSAHKRIDTLERSGKRQRKDTSNEES